MSQLLFCHCTFNTAASFATNTNWQSYGGESTMSYFTQMAGLAYHNFVSAAVGIAVAIAFIIELADVLEQMIEREAGFPVRVYELKAGRHRNEALDVAVGNYAALCALYAMGLTLDRLAARRQRSVSAESSGPPPAAPPFQVAPGSAPAPQSPL